MKLSIIAAINNQNVIGINGRIPWHYPEDLKRFKRLTMGKPIIMGRKTWESLGSKPLPGRLNVVVTSSGRVKEGPYGRETVVLKVSTLETILEFLSENTTYEEAFVIGGEQLYTEALPLADTVYLTHVKDEAPVHISDSDEVAYFPLSDLGKYDWGVKTKFGESKYLIFHTWSRGLKNEP